MKTFKILITLIGFVFSFTLMVLTASQAQATTCDSRFCQGQIDLIYPDSDDDVVFIRLKDADLSPLVSLLPAMETTMFISLFIATTVFLPKTTLYS